MASNPQNLCQALPTGTRRAQLAPKWLLVSLVTQTDWIDVITVLILIVFKICGSFESNYLSFDQNNLIKNPIFFNKFLTPQLSHRNGFVFKIYVWISVFTKKNHLKIRHLVAEVLSKHGVSFFLGHPVIFWPQTHFSRK